MEFSALNIDKIKEINEQIVFYEQFSDMLVEKMRQTPIYSQEEDDYLKKIAKVDEWISQLKKLKEEFYETA